MAWTEQEAFEAGVTIGLRAAEAILREGGGIAAVRRHVEQMEDVHRRRRREASGIREMEAGDLLLAMPIAHPGDLGLPATPADDWRSAVSSMKLVSA